MKTVDKAMGKKGRIENLKSWKKGQSGNPKGRARKFVTQMGIEGYRLSEINDTIKVLLSLRKDELQKVANSISHTVLEIAVAKAIMADFKRGTVLTVETVLSRVFGKPKNEITATIKATENIKMMLPDNETSDEK